MEKKCKAALVDQNHKLVIGEIPIPDPGPGEILIRVKATGINRADVYQRNGEYSPPPGASPILGLEVSGVVEKLGDGTKRFKIGDKVMALITGGGYAEYCLSSEETTLAIPNGLSFVEGAAIPEAYFTVWSNVFDLGRLKEGEILLVHGGASGVGSTTIQMAKAMGAKVIATVGSNEKAKACLKLGADLVINHKTEDFVARIKEYSKDGIDVIFDWIGTNYFEKHISLLRRNGRLILIDTQTGDFGKLDLIRLLTKNLHVMGSVLRPRPLSEKAAFASAIEKHFMPQLASGEIKPLIHGTFELADAQKAHQIMEESGHVGKLVLSM